MIARKHRLFNKRNIAAVYAKMVSKMYIFRFQISTVRFWKFLNFNVTYKSHTVQKLGLN